MSFRRYRRRLGWLLYRLLKLPSNILGWHLPIIGHSDLVDELAYWTFFICERLIWSIWAIKAVWLILLCLMPG